MSQKTPGAKPVSRPGEMAVKAKKTFEEALACIIHEEKNKTQKIRK